MRSRFKRMRLLGAGFISLPLVYFVLFATGLGPWLPGYHLFIYTPDAYLDTLEEIHATRRSLTEIYSRKFVRADQYNVLADAGSVLSGVVVHDVFPYWYGTAYDYYGKTEIPGRGKVACGYFVTTVLQDVGLPIQRERLAQLPSETMISELVGMDAVHRFSDVEFARFLAAVVNMKDGLFVVGLDTHTGFLHVDGERVTFIHASGRYPYTVIHENAWDSATLEESRYRVVGKVSDNVNLLSEWLQVERPEGID